MFFCFWEMKGVVLNVIMIEELIFFFFLKILMFFGVRF